MDEKPKQGRAITRVILVFGILFIPTLIFYLFIYTGVHHVRRLPFYGEKKIVDKEYRGKIIQDTVYHEVEKFSIPAVYGDTIDSAYTNGRIYVASFLEMEKFSKIPKQIIYSISEALEADSEVVAITFLMDYVPEQDTVQLPSSITDKMKGMDGRWMYAYGPSSEWMPFRDRNYFPETPGQKAYDVYNIVIIDREGRIRGYYDPTIAEDVKRLKEELRFLKKEYSLNYKTHRFYKYDDKPEQKRD